MQPLASTGRTFWISFAFGGLGRLVRSMGMWPLSSLEGCFFLSKEQEQDVINEVNIERDKVG